MSHAKCSIFFHNYYGRHNYWINFFAERINIPFNLFYNIVEDSIYNLGDEHFLKEGKNLTDSQINKFFLRKSANKGKDIGGKMVLLDAYLRLNEKTEYLVFLHDKQSPHTIHGSEWQKKLFRIADPGFAEKAIDCFTKEDKIGIIAGKGNIRNEYDIASGSLAGNNSERLKDIQSEFGISTSSHDYIAGTMFWVRSEPVEIFFKAHNPLEIRKTLEEGNVMDEDNGTTTHAWERLLCWIILGQGYKIKEL
jgi:lipopolysaccharide biosynthesis protein